MLANGLSCFVCSTTSSASACMTASFRKPSPVPPATDLKTVRRAALFLSDLAEVTSIALRRPE